MPASTPPPSGAHAGMQGRAPPAMFVFAVCLLPALALACGGNDRPADSYSGAVFRSATGTIEVGGDADLTATLQRAQDYPFDRLTEAYIAPIEDMPGRRIIDARLESSDGYVLISLLLEVDREGTYELAGESDALHVLLGDNCYGGNGNVFDGCEWYSTFFFSEGCMATIETANDALVAGELRCDRLGANCYEGFGGRDDDGACLDGHRTRPISFTASFRLEDPDPGAAVPRAGATSSRLTLDK